MAFKKPTTYQILGFVLMICVCWPAGLLIGLPWMFSDNPKALRYGLIAGILLFLSPLLLLGLWFGGVWYSEHHPDQGEHARRVSFLPETATDVSWYRSYNSTGFDFKISEADFKKWSRWEVREIAEPFSVFLRRNAGQEQIKIKNGLYYFSTARNGGITLVAYDRASGRAYFYSTPR